MDQGEVRRTADRGAPRPEELHRRPGGRHHPGRDRPHREPPGEPRPRARPAHREEPYQARQVRGAEREGVEGVGVGRGRRVCGWAGRQGEERCLVKEELKVCKHSCLRSDKSKFRSSASCISHTKMSSLNLLLSPNATSAKRESPFPEHLKSATGKSNTTTHSS